MRREKESSRVSQSSTLMQVLGFVGCVAGLALLLLTVMPCVSAYAESFGSVGLGLSAGKQIVSPEPGDSSSIEMGIDIGFGDAEHGSVAGDAGGTVEIGVSVGFVETFDYEHTVTFDAGRGVFGDGESVLRELIDQGACIEDPEPAPTRQGWSFVGWYVASGDTDISWDSQGESTVPLGEEWDFSRRVFEDVCLHAKWTEPSGADSVELGIAVADRACLPNVGDTGSASLGVAVGLVKIGGSDSGDKYGGTASLGVAVGYRAATREVTVRFEAGLGSFEGGSVIEETAAVNEVLEPPEDPKRAGWQFGGWYLAGSPDEAWDMEGVSTVPLGEEWDFSRGVAGDVTLHARWELRLDVTVPVSVAFAVDASTGEAIGPDPGRYALRSRTVRDVEVESLALECRQGELEAFFEEPAAGWQAALSATTLSLGGERAPEIALPFADASSAGPAWQVSRPLTEAERAGWRVPAFSYGATPPDGAWQGSDPSQRLALDVGLTIGDGLEVKTGQPGAVPIAHLRVTVSARP